MTTKRMGRAGWHQAVPNIAKSTCNFTGIVPLIKAAIITLALWGRLSMGLVDRAIHRGAKTDG